MKLLLAFLFILITGFAKKETSKPIIMQTITLSVVNANTLHWETSEDLIAWLEIEKAGSENGNFRSIGTEIISGGTSGDITLNAQNPNGYFRLKIGGVHYPDPIYSNVIKL